MKELTQKDQYQLIKGWLNKRQSRLYVATGAKRIDIGEIARLLVRQESAENDPQRDPRTGGRSELSAKGATTQGRRRKKDDNHQGRDAASRFGGDAEAQGKSTEPTQVDKQVGKQAEGELSAARGMLSLIPPSEGCYERWAFPSRPTEDE